MQYLNGDDQFVKEFFDRTKTIIEQYPQILNLGDKNYDMTLYCNCLVGLLIFPEQKYYKKIKKDLLSEKNYKLLRSSIQKKDEQRYTLRLIFSRMRNAVAHGHIKFPKSNYTNDNKIHSIIFYDDRNKDKQKSSNDTDLENFEFRLEIAVEDLKEIIEEFCDNVFESEVEK